MADSTYPAFSVFAFISFVLVLIPLPWHFQAWNSGTCLYMIWTAVGCLNLFINSIIWHNNAIDWAPVWCDISTRIVLCVGIAIPAASLCINRRLYKIASCRTATISRAEKKRAVLVDLAIGLGIPLIQIPLQFIVQGHRYDIFEDIGCYPTTVNTPAAYPLSFVWSNVIGIISAVYCLLTLRAFMQRRAEFSKFLSYNTSLTMNRYFRLMSLATVELLFNLPISSYGLYLNATIRPIYPWTSWSDIHSDWFTISTYPALIWQSNRIFVINLELSRWALVFCALVFFAFFGFADEARKNYRKACRVVAKRFGYNTSSSSKPSVATKALSGFMVKSDASQSVFVSRPLQLTSQSKFKSESLASTSPTSPFYKTERIGIYDDYKQPHDLMVSTPSSYSSCNTYTETLTPTTLAHAHKPKLARALTLP